MEYKLFGKKRTCNLVEYPKDFKMTEKQENILKDLLQIFKIWSRNAKNIEWWLDGGSLLGFARHQGFIPWDDDGDICVPLNYYENIKTLKVAGLNIQESVCGFKIRLEGKSHPFVDIFLVEKQDNYFRYCAPIIFGQPTYKMQKVYDKFTMPIDLVYPIKKGKFENNCLNVPAEVEKLLKINYGEDCLTHAKSWNQYYHRLDVENIDKIALSILPAVDIYERITKKDNILLPIIKKIVNH